MRNKVKKQKATSGQVGHKNRKSDNKPAASNLGASNIDQGNQRLKKADQRNIPGRAIAALIGDGSSIQVTTRTLEMELDVAEDIGKQVDKKEWSNSDGCS
jgi:hypothetical protein